MDWRTRPAWLYVDHDVQQVNDVCAEHWQEWLDALSRSRSASARVGRRRLLALGLACSPALASSALAAVPGQPKVPILVFHRFAASALDSMTVRVANFEAQLRRIEQLSCQVIPLSSWVTWRLALGSADEHKLPPRAVVLTADDGHRSQFEVMAPLLRERGWPVTLFVYPSAISNATYAMTWPQLRELAADPGVSVQSHSFWHPNFVRERARQLPEDFQRFVATQLSRSREVIEQRLARPVDLLAWPFGLGDDGLAEQAAQTGYRAAFSLGNRSASAVDPVYAAPRHLIVVSVDARRLASLLEAAFAERAPW